MKRFIIPILLAIVIAVPLIILFENVDLTPVLASEQGQNVDELFRVLYILASIVFGLVMGFLLYSVFAFRREKGDLTDAEPIYGHVGLEIAWTIIPLIVVLALGGVGAAALLDMSRPAVEAEALEISVIGSQWAWSFEYPQYDITTNELVLPVNRPARLVLSSRDVIHSFFIPEFRIKMDAVPGKVNELQLTATQVGEYRTYCAELCGTGHAFMVARVRVVDEPVFQEWVQNQQQPLVGPADPVAQGQDLYETQGCQGCHSLDGSRQVGPTFRGLFGSQQSLADGTTVVADEEYLRTSIIDPGRQVVEGYNNIMPGTYGQQLTSEQIEALIAFLQSQQ
jgi:cytochrome c oxidase subunit 2